MPTGVLQQDNYPASAGGCNFMQGNIAFLPFGCNNGYFPTGIDQQMLEQQLLYSQMLNEILYSSTLYSGWDNIPLFDVPTFDFSFNNGLNFNNLNFNLDSDFFDNSQDNSKSNKKAPVNLRLVDAGYDYIKGQKLARIAKKNVVGWTGKCATSAKTDIQNAGLGKYECGHAFQCAGILDRNPNFVRVEASLEDLKNTPGLVLVYGKGVSGYSKTYGHIEITGGDGCAYSDGVTHHIRPGAIVYAPVSNSKKLDCKA